MPIFRKHKKVIKAMSKKAVSRRSGAIFKEIIT